MRLPWIRFQTMWRSSLIYAILSAVAVSRVPFQVPLSALATSIDPDKAPRVLTAFSRATSASVTRLLLTNIVEEGHR